MIKALIILFFSFILSLGSFAQNRQDSIYFKQSGKYFRLYKGKNKLIKSPFVNYGWFVNGLCAVQNKNYSWGVIDSMGNTEIPFKYNRIIIRENGSIITWSDDACTFYNTEGEKINTYDFENFSIRYRDASVVVVPNPDSTRYGNYQYVFSLSRPDGTALCDSLFSAQPYFDHGFFRAVIYNSEYRIDLDGRMTFLRNIDYSTSDTTVEHSIIPPKFPGGEEGRIHFLIQNIYYPEMAKQTQKQGTVYVRFMVDKEGNAIYPAIVKGVCRSIDMECLRMIYEMPRWEPAREDNKLSDITVNMPFRFILVD
jgi:TonB family protein